ncbi:hypothetical protein BDV25DRAFT_136989 [Aspergillus avenaceus]|uniref:IDI-2 n=1 Tax=Aspergillus avenaceus TaxID=36643 RepID=A0A5N6U425_ASPAV|nr:hypothetical protein BDV25DRAFT_136989 [Aspergillus avenaceus]
MKLKFGILLMAAMPGAVFSRIVPKSEEVANDTAMAKEVSNVFAAQKCWTRSPYGCSKNRWCWKQCGGSGQWCWLAHNSGKGAWTSCTTDADCAPGTGDSDCGSTGCKACGCSC